MTAAPEPSRLPPPPPSDAADVAADATFFRAMNIASYDWPKMEDEG